MISLYLDIVSEIQFLYTNSDNNKTTVANYFILVEPLDSISRNIIISFSFVASLLGIFVISLGNSDVQIVYAQSTGYPEGHPLAPPQGYPEGYTQVQSELPQVPPETQVPP